MARPVYIDIGEFCSNPIRTGIQRVVRQVIAHWPADVDRLYVRYDPDSDSLVEVSDRLLRFICWESEQESASAEAVARHALLLQRAEGLRPVDLSAGDRVLVPELFYDGRRVAFYARLTSDTGAEPYLTVFDFMPWLRPNLYRIGLEASRGIMPYLRLTTLVRHRCFISAATRADFVHRIMRRPVAEPGPVIALGSDGLDMPRQSFEPSKKDLVCIGTLEGKKHQEVVFRAFLSLQRPRGGRLRFLGKVPSDLAPWLREVVDYRGPDVEVVDAPSDAMLRQYISRARASIFISSNEGFGLPAVETLYCGLPTVVHAELPALVGVPDGGQIRLRHLTTEAVAGAMSRLDDDAEAARLWDGAATLDLPSWRDYAATLARWVRAA